MSMTIPLTFNTQTLAPFRAAWNRASENPTPLSAALLERCMHIDTQHVPASLQEQIGNVRSIATLLTDSHWMMDSAARQDFAGALRYFDKADDLIPDDDPQFGLLDDAIVIELALAEHREVWSAWQEYRQFCSRHRELGPVSRQQWLDLRARVNAPDARHSYVDKTYADDRRSRYRMTQPLPRLDLN